LAIKMNLLVNEVPWGAEVAAHVDTTQGALIVEEGHLDEVDLHVTVDYGTARALLVDGQPQAAMAAFMAGKIRVDGDLAKLMAVQSTSPDEAALAFAAEVRSLTA
jgi:putative sterol carrier protein